MPSPSTFPNTPESASSAQSHILTRGCFLFRFALLTDSVVKWELGSGLASRIGVRIQAPLRRPLGRPVRCSPSGAASVITVGIRI